MKKLDWILLICGLLLAVSRGSGQPAFQNLDFESANVVGHPNGASFSDALPGWLGFFGYGTDSQTQVLRVEVDGIALGGFGISILDPAATDLRFPRKLEGNYSVLIQNDYPVLSRMFSTTILQTGLIPTAAQSLQMKIQVQTPEELSVAIGGHNIAMFPLQVTSNYTLYGGDIAAFAGQVQELRFTTHAVPQGTFFGVVLDSIEFSPEAIPEPRSLSLVTGAFFLAIHIAKRRRRRPLT